MNKTYQFSIEYEDPETGETVTEIKDFTDSPPIRALEWAEDYAYFKASKGKHSATCIRRVS